MKKVKDLNSGKAFIYGGYEWVKLGDTKNGVLAITKDILPAIRKFDKKTDDYRKSEIREWLNENFLNTLIDNGAKEENFLLFGRDLTADDGTKDYKTCADNISLITCDEYRKYREFIPTVDDYWWTATPYSCLENLSSSVRLVDSDGSLLWYYACDDYGGVRPVCCLRSDTFVVETTAPIDENTNDDKGANKMTYKEFKKEIKSIDDSLQVELFNDEFIDIHTSYGRWVASIDQKYSGTMFNNSDVYRSWHREKRLDLLDVLYKFARTPIEEREIEKRYIIPLPQLMTTDGEQQYLTQKGEKLFACRRNKELIQTWKEEQLQYIPEEYRKYAEVLNED